MNGVAQKAVWSTADVHRDNKQLPKNKFSRELYFRDRGILEVNVGHILHFEATQIQTLV